MIDSIAPTTASTASVTRRKARVTASMPAMTPAETLPMPEPKLSVIQPQAPWAAALIWSK